MGVMNSAKQKIREIIGRVQTVGTLFQMAVASIDRTKPDYKFWDTFRYGKANGFEFGSLFAKPIVDINASWALGDGLEAKLVDREDIPEATRDYTNGRIKSFLRRNLALFMRVIQDLYSLGDQYVIVNADGSLSTPSPDTVKVDYDPLDYRRMVKVTVTSEFDDATVADVYTAENRVVTVTWKDRSKGVQAETYNNLIGRIPVIHFANDRSANETNGRPIYEAMYHLFSRYNRLLNKALDGAELMSNPKPVLEGLEDIDETIEANSEAPTDGNDNRVINFQRLGVILLGKGGSFKFASPAAGFTTDIRNMLKSLFLLVLEFTRIPEVIWGSELSSSRATAGEQMTTFYSHIKGRRIMLEGEGADEEGLFEPRGGLLAVLHIWLLFKALTDRQIAVAPTEMIWSDLETRNEDQTFKWVEWADKRGYLRPETALDQADLKGVDAVTEIEATRTQDPAADPFEDGLDDESDLMPDLGQAA